MSIAHQNAHTIIRDILSKQHIERVWFVGCGGSLTGFWPGKYFLDCEAKSWPSAMLPVMNLSMRRRTR